LRHYQLQSYKDELIVSALLIPLLGRNYGISALWRSIPAPRGFPFTISGWCSQPIACSPSMRYSKSVAGAYHQIRPAPSLRVHCQLYLRSASSAWPHVHVLYGEAMRDA